MNSIQFFANKDCSKKENLTIDGHGPAGKELFELQTWFVDIGNGQNEWCGKLHNVSTGETRFFKGWPGLIANLQEILTPFAQLEVMRTLMPMEEVMYLKNKTISSFS